ncbi:hypothetical protein [Streptomyces sp. NPDC048142]|uniref:hypothetical protein n=1 Tax=Streptomyces sp. NPDC048142 TaxID=3365501 RepID=UPI003714B120
MPSVIEPSGPFEPFVPFESCETFDGTTSGWRRLGSGPPVVMVHGSGGGLWWFTMVLRGESRIGRPVCGSERIGLGRISGTGGSLGCT